MKTLINHNTTPQYNLALEEYLLKEFPLEEDLFYMWQNQPCIVIGRNQNPYNEVNLLAATDANIPIIRRISGGGTVYHDLGNINFTYITNTLTNRLNNYEYFLHPIITLLQQVGVPATFVKESHIYVNNKKISGNAQSYYKNRMIHHGTLLFDTDLDQLTVVLDRSTRYSSHAVPSTKATTINIKEILPIDTTVEAFMEFIQSEMLLQDQSSILSLSDKDIKQIHKLEKEKYHTFEWNFGETHPFQIETTYANHPWHLDIKNGRIESSTLFPSELIGIPFHPTSIQTALSTEKNISTILQLLF